MLKFHFREDLCQKISRCYKKQNNFIRNTIVNLKIILILILASLLYKINN